MPASEIDDIFSGVASSSTTVVANDSKQKSKKSGDKKRKADVVEARSDSHSKASISKGRSLVLGKDDVNIYVNNNSNKMKTKSHSNDGGQKAETVFDPSKVIESKVKAKQSKSSSSSSLSKKKLTEEEEDFMNTRGKNRRKTEDGFLIYKADELKIDEESGGTPLCPFDCECCH